MAKQITDDVDRLKRQARRRLIGAIALIVAIVVLLPMVLDNEPKPAVQDIELRIPDKDKVGVFAPRIDSPPPSMPEVNVAVNSAAAMVKVPQVAAKKSVKVVPKVKHAKASVKAVATQPKPKPKKVKREVKAKPPKPAAASHKTKKSHAASKSKFIVQVGAFSNVKTARSWQVNFKLQGFNAYTEKTGNKTRVRIGPFPTRAAADKTRRKLEKKGLRPNVIELK